MLKHVTVTFMTLTLGTNALACGNTSEKREFRKTEIATPVGGGILIINPVPGYLKIGNKFVFPFRAEFPGKSRTAELMIQTRGSETRLTLFAKYRCLDSPTYTQPIFLEIGEFDEVRIYALENRGQILTAEQKPDLVIKGGDLMKQVGIAIE